MVNVIIVDLTLLVLFIIFISIFLYLKRKNIGTEGGLILYRTQWGVKLINYIGKKYKKTLKALSYVSIFIGYILMATILWLMAQSVYLYLTTSVARVIKAPPIMPLIPYFPKLFGVQSFFPPFYFVYFIISILIVATVHEFSHGIFAKRYKIKIKSTGFAFLKYFPAIFGAFVEQDEKQMTKKKNFEQMAVLSAGVFANLIITILFFIILASYHGFAFNAAGITFDTYSYSAVNISDIASINGLSLTTPSYENILFSINDNGILNKITTKDGGSYITTKKSLESQNDSKSILVLYDDAPAINSEIDRIITEIEGVSIKSIDDLAEELGKHPPGDKIEIKTTGENGEETKEVVLGANPENKKLAWLGIGFLERNSGGVMGKVYSTFSFFKEEHVYYEPKFSASVFIYDLFWWIIIINLLVALFNMLPLGFLDGGRFFYLTILGLAKSKKMAERAFKGVTYFLLLLFVILIVRWILIFF